MRYRGFTQAEWLARGNGLDLGAGTAVLEDWFALGVVGGRGLAICDFWFALGLVGDANGRGLPFYSLLF